LSDPFTLAGKRVFVAGHRGMVGSALCRALAGEGCTILTAGRGTLDLTDQRAVGDWLAREVPDVVVVAAAKVGGIKANDTYPADFLYENLMIEANLIHAAHVAGIERLLFLGSSCIYPKFAEQPIREDSLMTGPLEPTNEWYAVAKIAGIKLCDAYRRQHGRHYISAMPTNLYGPGDNYHPENSHVVPALLRRFHEAREAGAESVTLWGTGTPRREFLHADDLAAALVVLMQRFDEPGPINVGYGSDVTILELAGLIAEVTGFGGRIEIDPTKPDGTPRKLLDSSRMHALGWAPKIDLREGLEDAYRWFLEQKETVA
jgi:GDP-L-fucose synthase